MLLIKVFDGWGDIANMFYEMEKYVRVVEQDGSDTLQIWDGTKWRDYDEFEIEQVFEQDKKLVYGANKKE